MQLDMVARWSIEWRAQGEGRADGDCTLRKTTTMEVDDEAKGRRASFMGATDAPGVRAADFAMLARSACTHRSTPT